MSYSGAFDKAVESVHSLPKSGPVQPGYEDKLSLYGLYKQATEGDITQSRPSVFDPLGRAKHDSWKKRKGLTPSDARRLYVEKLIKILKAFADKPQAVNLIKEIQTYLPPDAVESYSEYDEDDSSTDESNDQVANLPPRLEQHASLIAAARQSRQAAQQSHPISDTSDDEASEESIDEDEQHAQYRQLMSSSLEASRSASASTHHIRPPSTHSSSHVPPTEFERQWMAKQQALSQLPPSLAGGPSSRGLHSPAPALGGAASSYSTTPVASAQYRPPSSHSQSQHYHTYPAPPFYSRPPSVRPPSVRPGTVPVEQTLQAIGTSLTALHERINDLERANAAAQKRAKEGQQWFVQRILARFLRLLGLGRLAGAGDGGGQPSLWTLLWLLWGSVREGLILAIAGMLFLNWRRDGQSLREMSRQFWLTSVFRHRMGRQAQRSPV